MRLAALAGAYLLSTSGVATALEVVVESVELSGSPSNAVQGTLDLLVHLGPGESPPDLAGWQAAVDLDAPGGEVVFLAPYAEAPPGPDPPPLLTDNFVADFGGDNGAARASATAFLDAGGIPFVDGAALMRIPFEVAPGAQGTYAVSLDLDPFSGTVLTDTDSNGIAFSAVDGALSISPTAVPAMGVAGRLALAAALLAIARSRRLGGGSGGGRRDELRNPRSAAS